MHSDKPTKRLAEPSERHNAFDHLQAGLIEGLGPRLTLISCGDMTQPAHQTSWS